jgi:hypothetical protein
MCFHTKIIFLHNVFSSEFFSAIVLLLRDRVARINFFGHKSAYLHVGLLTLKLLMLLKNEALI